MYKQRYCRIILIGYSIFVWCMSCLCVPFVILSNFQRLFVRRTQIRSLWAGTPILTLAVLAKAERSLGVDAKSLVYKPYYLSTRFDYVLSDKYPAWLLITILPFFVLLWACWTRDRFHFFCDRGLLPQIKRFEFNPIELLIYRMCGKEVFFYTYGADVRTQKITEALGDYNCCMHCTAEGSSCVCDEKVLRRNMARISKSATAVFSMGDMIEYLPDSRKRLFYWPLDLDNGSKYSPVYPSEHSDGSLNVVHASNHREFKGTQFIIDAVEKLKVKGRKIELKLTENVPNAEALNIYRMADVIIDQCIIGFHGYFALEAMALGKPVICYIRKPEKYLLNYEQCPILNCSPDNIEDMLCDLIENRTVLRKLGEEGRKYVERNYSVESFAGRLKDEYIDMGISM